MKKKKKMAQLDGPLLEKISVGSPQTEDTHEYPFSLDIIKNLKTINFSKPVTFFVGENGTGKSTLLEAIANNVGFGPEGGSKNIQFKTADEDNYSPAEKLSNTFTLSWRFKPDYGYFFRAESFFNVASWLDLNPNIVEKNYGGKSLHKQSHGESFLFFFKHCVGKDGFYIFDEPEAALSPQRQLALLTIIHDLCQNANTQFIIATHSPILLAYPNATIYSCDSDQLTEIAYEETEHYQITRDFMADPQRYLQYLLSE